MVFNVLKVLDQTHIDLTGFGVLFVAAFLVLFAYLNVAQVQNPRQDLNNVSNLLYGETQNRHCLHRFVELIRI